MPAQDPVAKIPSVAVIAAAAIAAYSRTFAVPFLFDDMPTIVDNRQIRHWHTALFPSLNNTASGRPIVNLSLAVNYAVSGTAVGSYHCVNLAIHVLAGLTLFGIVRRTLAPRAGTRAGLIAFCAALLWTLHPLQTEAVTYIVQRAESLMGLLYLFTLYCFIRYVEVAPDRRSGATWAFLSVFSCALGMGTKEVMVSAPVIVLLYDRTFLAGSFREALRRRGAVYGGLAATWLILAGLVHSTHGRSGTAGFGSGVSWWSYGLTQFPAIVRYLKLSLWPHPLVFDYGTQWARYPWMILPPALIVAGLMAATVGALVRRDLTSKSWGFAGAWFFAILAPTSLVPGNRQTAADHRMYLALVPVVVVLVLGVYRWLGRGALLLCLALAAVFCGITFQRNQDYRSALRIWTDTVAKVPENAFAHHNLAQALEEVPGRGDEAIAQYEEALRLKPDYVEAHNDLGAVFLKMPGRLNDAVAQFKEALRLKPDLAGAANNLGNAWLKTPGRWPDAIAQFQAALRLDPGYAEAHYNLANALSVRPESLPDAIAHYQEALRLAPDVAEVHTNLGNAWLRMPGHLNEAIAQYEAALRLHPDFAPIHYNLAVALLRNGETAPAASHFEAVLRLDPGNDSARKTLARIRAAGP